MPLQGTFDVLDFSDVLHLLARHELTGRLHVRTRSFTANLFLEQGTLVGADQSEHQATAATGDVAGRLEDICFELLDAERGGFEFHPGRPTSVASTTRLEVDAVVSRARKRLQDWQELQELIPSLELQPRLAEDLTATEITFDKQRWRLLTAIDGRRSLRAIGRNLNLSDFEVCRVVKSLVEDGVVEFDPRAMALAAAARESMVTAVDPGAGGPAPAAEPLVESAIAAAIEHVSVTAGPAASPPSPSHDAAEEPSDAPRNRRRPVVRIRSREPRPDAG